MTLAEHILALALASRPLDLLQELGEAVGEWLRTCVVLPQPTWVEPVVDAEIEYSAVTDDGLLRAAVFKGLRDDLGRPRQAAVASPARSTEGSTGYQHAVREAALSARPLPGARITLL
jgi:hypothetical protein